MPKRRALENSYESLARPKRVRRTLEFNSGAGDEPSEDEIHAEHPRLLEPQQHEDDSGDEIRPNKPDSQALSADEDKVVDLEENDDVPTQDEDEEDDDDDDIDEEEVNRLTKNAAKGFAISGILHSVRLDRFMCHDCFEYQLGPNVNIINGRNGSGKSAIVAALQVGLLGSVSSTERGRKLEDLIKHGSDNCIISIRIWNRRPGQSVEEADFSYKHDLYGDVITIERRLYKKGRGQNSYAVKARNRHVKLPPGRTPRQEVQAIVDHFGFMVDNPVAVLTQTKSKEFLAKGKPTDSYKLYRKATLLGPLEDELVKTKAITLDVESMLKSKENSQAEVAANLEKKEAAYIECQEMKNIGSRIQHAELLFAWTLVEEDEIILNGYKERLMNEFQPAAEKARMVFDKSQKEMNELEEVRNKDSDQLKEAVREVDLAKDISRKAQKLAKSVEMRISHQKRKEQECEAEIEVLQRNITKAKERREQARQAHFAGQEQKSRLVLEVQHIESATEQVKDQVSSCRERESNLRAERLRLEDTVRKTSGEVQRLEKDFEAKRREHMQAMSYARNSNSLARFDPSMPDICRKIEQRQNEFHRIPIGPVGRHVKMLDESWAAAVESAIGLYSLRTFIVHDAHDSQILESLFPRRGLRPTILIADVDRGRYSIQQSHMPEVASLGHHTILETIGVDHDAVFNFLVDQSQIERNVLNGKDEDITVLGWSRRENLHTVWNKSCDRAYTRNGSNTFRQARGNKNARILSRDMQPFLQSLESELQAIEGDSRASKVRMAEVETTMRDVSQNLRDVHREIEQLQTKVTGLTRKKAALEDQLNRAENAFDPAPFEQEIAGYEDSIREQELLRGEVTSQLQELESENERLTEEVRKAELEARGVRGKATMLMTQLDTSSNQLARLRSKHKQLKKDVDSTAHVVELAHREVSQQENKIAGLMTQARNFGSCPDGVDAVKKPAAKCQRELQKLKSRLLAEEERRGGRSAEEIEKDFLVAKRKDGENKEVLGRIRHYVKALTRGIKTRQRKLQSLTIVLKKLVRNNFRSFMSRRGHKGKIQFSVDNGVHELHLLAVMASHTKGDGERHVTKDMKSLSGGEKSFTTLSFILALAEICQNPVRIMDEVDCFQDDATRRVSYKETIKFFTDHVTNRQIILITPLQLPVDSLQSLRGVKVVRLEAPREEDPRRRQTHLDEFLPQ